MDNKENKKIPSALFEVVFEMVSYIDEIDRKKYKDKNILKDSYNKSINNVDKTNIR
ncbi:MAG: hypothetical protein GX308_00715 [Epulopiscium sp.]|nr:hypothetical protein [Candidatus Epulonipiscium sp.]